MMTHARGRASKCTLWPSVSLCLCGSKNPFLLGKDLQISSTERFSVFSVVKSVADRVFRECAVLRGFFIGAIGRAHATELIERYRKKLE